MWKTFSEWLLALLNMTRELQENRARVRRLEERLRDMEEAIKLLAQEQRHTRELEAVEREKLLLRFQQEAIKHRELPAPRGKQAG